MRIAAIIIAIFGAMNLMALPRAFHFADNPRWPLTLLACILGILLLSVAVGIWRRRIFAWQLGFGAIVLSAAYFFAEVCFTLPAVTVSQKVVILISCFVGGVLVAAYWSVVWYRQRKWFINDQVV